jgi:hypothetical protein
LLQQLTDESLALNEQADDEQAQWMRNAT